MEARRREPFEREPGEGRVLEATSGMARTDLVRWGPTWAGFFVTLAVTAVLVILGGALGLTTARAGAPAGDVSTATGLWAPTTLIIGLLAGGYTMMRLAGVGGRSLAMAHGTLLWAVTLIMGALLVALGLGALFGSALPGMMGATPGMPPGTTIPESTTALWGTIVTLLLGLGAAMLGAWLGDQGTRADRIERVTRAAA